MMPTITKVLREDDLQAKTRVASLDLSAYLELLNSVVAEGVGATVTLGPDEQQRTEKRRLSMAAKELGYHLTWRKGREQELRFVLAKPGEPVPGSRKRRAKVEPPIETPAPVRRGRRKAG
jgi:hypothetical protein